MFLRARTRCTHQPSRSGTAGTVALRRAAPWRRLAVWGRDESGVSAVEFALIGPMLVFASFWTIDLGLAMAERMAIDHILRVGAQIAMLDGGEAKILQVMRDAASGQFAVQTGSTPTASGSALVLSACTCPITPSSSQACQATCAEAPALAFYEIAASKTYTGTFRNFSIDQSMRVLVR